AEVAPTRSFAFGASLSRPRTCVDLRTRRSRLPRAREGRVARYETDQKFNAAALAIRERCLRDSDSLFTPGHPVWKSEVAGDLLRRTVGQPDFSSGSLLPKLEGQLKGASDDAKQLAAELLY